MLGYLDDKKGEMAMGTLIIFISMILVAAIAAAVLLTTTSSLQNQALQTGSATTQEVGTSLKVLELYGEDGTTNQSLNGFTEVIRLSSGSNPIRFEDLLITTNLDNASQNYEYNSSATDNASIGCNESTTLGVNNGYIVEYNLEGSQHRDGFLTPGDVAQVCFQSPRAVGETEEVEVRLVPRTGQPNVVQARLPNLVIDQRETVYP